MTIFLLTLVNAVMVGTVAYLFFAFRHAVDASGVKQIDEYLHELEGSVSQLTEQFERTSTKISKDLLRKTSELQMLIGECDTKLAQARRVTSELAQASSTALSASPLPATPVVDAAENNGSSEQPESVSETPPAAAQFVPMPVVSLPAAGGMTASEMLASQAAARQRVDASTPQGARSVTRSSHGGDRGMNGRGIQPDQADGDPRQPTAAQHQHNEKYRLIFLLASEGMDTASIAKHTNLTRGEIEMLLDLRRQGKI